MKIINESKYESVCPDLHIGNKLRVPHSQKLGILIARSPC